MILHFNSIRRAHTALSVGIIVQLTLGLAMIIGFTFFPERMEMGIGSAAGILIGIGLLLGSILFYVCNCFCFILAGIEKALHIEKASSENEGPAQKNALQNCLDTLLNCNSKDERDTYSERYG